MAQTPQVGPADLAALARRAEDLAAAAPAAADPPAQRLFPIWEITRYMIPVTAAHFRRVLRGDPALPQGRPGPGAGARWFTAAEVADLRPRFPARGGGALHRPAGRPAAVVATAGLARGAGRTTLAADLAVAAALDGVRVLAVDLDPEAGLTARLGGAVPADTALSLLAADFARHLQATNRRRADRGEPALPLEDRLSAALDRSAAGLVTRGRWPGLGLIGASARLARAELDGPDWRQLAPSWRHWRALAGALATDGLLEEYDLVLIDTPPGLGQLTLAGLGAADILLVPVAGGAAGLPAAAAALGLFADAFAAIEAAETRAARALGLAAPPLRWSAVRAVLTGLDPGRPPGATAAIEAALGAALLPARLERTALAAAAAARGLGSYDLDHRALDRAALAAGRAGPDAAWTAVRALVAAHWAS